MSSYLQTSVDKNTGRNFSSLSVPNKKTLLPNAPNSSLRFSQPKLAKSINDIDLATLFKAKNNLDLVNITTKSADCKLRELPSSNYLALARKSALSTKQCANMSIASLEKSLSNSSLEIFSSSSINSKITLSEHLSKEVSSDIYVSNNIQNSTESAFDLASSTRWLLRLLPISENLANANSYYSSLKPLNLDPTKNSKSATSNIWLSNFLGNSDPKNITNIGSSGLNYYASNSSIIDSFESSRN